MTATQSGVHATVPVTVTELSQPAAIVNSSTWMDVFYDNPSGNLMNAWWQSTNGWHDQVLATGMVGSPAAIVNSSTWMDVFYDSSSGDLMNEWWQSTQWLAQPGIWPPAWWGRRRPLPAQPQRWTSSTRAPRVS